MSVEPFQKLHALHDPCVTSVSSDQCGFLTKVHCRLPLVQAILLVGSLVSTSTLAAHGTADATADVSHPNGEQPICLYVSSYHRGYRWSDGVEQGLRRAIGNYCDIVQFDMDTKRHRDVDSIARAVSEARALIDRIAPDIVITSDDNAAKFLIVPYLVDTATPVVFSGINWTVEEYGFPASNVTGIVEVAPIRPMIREAMAMVPDARRAAYIGATTLTELKNYERIAEIASLSGVTLDSLFVEDMKQWKNAFDTAQTYDFVISGSHSGIVDWDADEAESHALASTRRPSLTSHEWMMPVSMVGYTKLPEEHGERAGTTAIAILQGTEVRDIPLITNRKWDTWLNVELAAVVDVPVPERLVRRAKQAGRKTDRQPDKGR